jgi:hypothetical protein
MQSRLPDTFRPEDQPTVHRWARTLTVFYSLSLVALVAFALASYQFAGGQVKTADRVHAAVTPP